MKFGTRLISFFLVCVMVFTATAQVFAETFNVGNDDQMVSSWETASSNNDSENTFNMTSNINMEGHVLNAESGKSYIINGNGNVIQNVEISGEKNSDVTINANVSSSTDTALTVSGTSSTDVLINGNVTTVTEDGTDDGETALAVYGANVMVNGDVGLAVAGGSDNVNQNVVEASEGANVIISGDVFSAEEGITVALGAEVTVKQDLETVGNTIISIEDTKVTVEGDVDGESCLIMGGQVRVGGNFTVEDSIVVSAGSLMMDDNSTLEADTVKIYNNSGVSVGDIQADTVTVGISALTGKDKSDLACESITNTTNSSTLETGKNATVEVMGNVDHVVARNNSEVIVHGSADSAKRYDKAKITVHQSNSQPNVGTPESGSNPSYDPLVKLCQGYDSMNDLHEQTELLFDLMLMVEKDLCAEMNLATAFWASLFSYNDILTSHFNPDNYTMYDTGMYNAESVESLKNAGKVNPYYVSTYKDTLAEAISEITPVPMEISDTEKEIVSAIVGIPGDVSDVTDALDLDALNYLEKLIKEGGSFTPKDAQLFMLMTKDTVINGAESRRLADLVTVSNTVVNNADFIALAGEVGISVAELVMHLFGEYESQISYLDHILQEESLSPALFIAATDLRFEYSEKLAGAISNALENMLEYGAEWLINKGIDKVVTKYVGGGLWGTVNLGVDIFGFVSGGSKDSKDLQTASAMPEIANTAMRTYIDAIRNVQNGDTSEKAIQQVKSSFVVLRTTLSNMCEIMTNIGDKDQEKIYQGFVDTLDQLKIGYSVEI